MFKFGCFSIVMLIFRAKKNVVAGWKINCWKMKFRLYNDAMGMGFFPPRFAKTRLKVAQRRQPQCLRSVKLLRLIATNL